MIWPGNFGFLLCFVRLYSVLLLSQQCIAPVDYNFVRRSISNFRLSLSKVWPSVISANPRPVFSLFQDQLTGLSLACMYLPSELLRSATCSDFVTNLCPSALKSQPTPPSFLPILGLAFLVLANCPNFSMLGQPNCTRSFAYPLTSLPLVPCSTLLCHFYAH